MRLINLNTLELGEYFGDQIPPYAILSHCWCDEEVIFQDWPSERLKGTMAGYRKIKHAIEAVRKLREDEGVSGMIRHLWCDTVCINKDSSAELSEAINSMYRWYKDSKVCLVYLDDYEHGGGLGPLGKARWFTRGWTLQELLAPSDVRFFDRDWSQFGTKSSLAEQISAITSIRLRFLDGTRYWKGGLIGPIVYTASVAEKMSWAASRSTTREEDMAYCLLGIFEINMPLLYGEGHRAFLRLQEEILKYSNDQSIFCFKQEVVRRYAKGGFLARSPCKFAYDPLIGRAHDVAAYHSESQLTNRGVRISLPMFTDLQYGGYLVLNTYRKHRRFRVCIPYWGQRDGTLHRDSDPEPFLVPCEWPETHNTTHTVYLHHNRGEPGRYSYAGNHAVPATKGSHSRFGLIPLFPIVDVDRKSTSWTLHCEGEEDYHATHDGRIIYMGRNSKAGVWGLTIRAKEPGCAIQVDITVTIPEDVRGEWRVACKLTTVQGDRHGMVFDCPDFECLPEALDLSRTTLDEQGKPVTHHVRPILIPLGWLTKSDDNGSKVNVTKF